MAVCNMLADTLLLQGKMRIHRRCQVHTLCSLRCLNLTIIRLAELLKMYLDRHRDYLRFLLQCQL